MKIVIFSTIFLSGTFCFAYLDPGSGSLFIQAAIAGIISFLYFFKSKWYYIKSFFHTKKAQQAHTNLNKATNNQNSSMTTNKSELPEVSN